MAVTRFFRNRDGFSYTELMAGMGILLLAISFITVMYRFSSQNRIVAREITAMATVAQNMAEAFKATRGANDDAKSAAISEGQSEGFPAEKIEVEYLLIDQNDPDIDNDDVYKVIIKIKPRMDIDSLGEYTLVFYTLDKSGISD